MKKVLTASLTALLLISMLSVLFAAPASAATPDMLDLTTLPIKEFQSVNASLPSVNTNAITAGAYMTISGFPVEKGVANHNIKSGTQDCWIDYDISAYNYDTFTVVVGKVESPDYKVVCTVLGDGAELATSGVIGPNDLAYFECSVKGVKTLRLHCANGGDGITSDEIIWAYPTLINKADLKAASLKVGGISAASELGKDLDLTNARAIVTYNTGAFEQIALDKVTFTGFDKNQYGEQTVTAAYNGLKYEFNVTVRPADELNYVENLTITDKLIIKNMEPTINKDFDGKTAFAIGGFKYAHAIGFHSLAAADPAESHVTFDIADQGYTSLHAVAGKTWSTYKFNAQFLIYGDGEKLAESPILKAGESYIFDVDITGVKALTLAIASGNDGYNSDASGFGDVVLFKAAKAPEVPTEAPTAAPTAAPTEAPTAAPTDAPTEAPTAAPTAAPTEAPTAAPTAAPTEAPTAAPTAAPTEAPTAAPTAAPTEAPTVAPTEPVTEPENPSTGDSFAIYAIVAVVAVLGTAVVIRKKVSE